MLLFLFSIVLILCPLLSSALWKVCWLEQRQEKYSGKWCRKTTQIFLKHFGNTVAVTQMSPPAIRTNCFNSFPSFSLSCISKLLISSYYFKGQPAWTTSTAMTWVNHLAIMVLTHVKYSGSISLKLKENFHMGLTTLIMKLNGTWTCKQGTPW